MKSKTVERLLNEISLKDIIIAHCDMAFLKLPSELGYREKKSWTSDEDEIYDKILDLSKGLSDNIMEAIKEHERPKKSGLLEELENHLENTSKDDHQREWDATKEWDSVGPTIDDFLEVVEPLDTYNAFFKDAWEHFSSVRKSMLMLKPPASEDKLREHIKWYEQITTQEEFIDKIKTDDEFAKKCGFQVDIIELDLHDRMGIYFKIHPDWAMMGTHHFFDNHNIPSKLIIITHNNKKIEIYERE